jgi:hypothetical protein
MIAELSISKEAKTMIDLSRLAEFQPPPDKRMELASFIPGPDSGAGPDTISNDAFYGRDLSPNKTESRLSLAADISDDGGGSPGFPSHEASHADTQKAEQKANLCRQFVQMTMDGPLSGNQAAAALGRSAAWFSINVPKWHCEGLAAFLPPPRGPSASLIFPDLPGWFLPAAQFFYMLTNLTRYGGSVPEAQDRQQSALAA